MEGKESLDEKIVSFFQEEKEEKRRKKWEGEEKKKKSGRATKYPSNYPNPMVDGKRISLSPSPCCVEWNKRRYSDHIRIRAYNAQGLSLSLSLSWEREAESL